MSDEPNYLKSIKKTNYTIIFNKENLGFAKANNQGIKIAVGDYLVLLNNDTEVINSWLDELIAVAESEEQIGIVGSLLFYPDGKHIQHAGVRIARKGGNLWPYHTHLLEYYTDLFNEIKTEQFQAVTGACMLVKRDTINKVGMLDESFINGYEDIDFCFRTNKNGLKVFLAHKSKVYHYESVSKGRNDHTSLNQDLFDKKWSGIINADVSFIHFISERIHIKATCMKKITHQPQLVPKLITALGKRSVRRLEILSKCYVATSG
jgi:GT2 family glycosyltransferase